MVLLSLLALGLTVGLVSGFDAVNSDKNGPENTYGMMHANDDSGTTVENKAVFAACYATGKFGQLMIDTRIATTDEPINRLRRVARRLKLFSIIPVIVAFMLFTIALGMSARQAPMEDFQNAQIVAPELASRMDHRGADNAGGSWARPEKYTLADGSQVQTFDEKVNIGSQAQLGMAQDVARRACESRKMVPAGYCQMGELEVADNWLVLDRATLTPVERDQLTYFFAQGGYMRGDPVRVRSFLADLSGAWQPTDALTRQRLRVMIDYARDNYGAVDLPVAERLAEHSLKRDLQSEANGHPGNSLLEAFGAMALLLAGFLWLLGERRDRHAREFDAKLSSAPAQM